MRNGFTEDFRYLHVYAQDPDEAGIAAAGQLGLRPVTGFFHASTENESLLRERFRRVHSCRRYLRELPPR